MGLTAEQRRALYDQELPQRQEESYARKDEKGRYRSVFKTEEKAGISFWGAKDGDHRTRIIPYIVGENNPQNLKPGQVAFICEIFTHRQIGINEDSILCPNLTFRKPCPICQHQADLKRRQGEGEDIPKEEISKLNASRRAIYNIVCYDDTSQEAKGVQVWEVSYVLFSEEVENLANKKRTGGKILYAHHNQGCIISFHKQGKGRDTEFSAFEFEERCPIDDSFLEQAHCLEDLVEELTYDEIYDMYWENAYEAAPDSQEAAEATRKPKLTEVEKKPEAITDNSKAEAEAAAKAKAEAEAKAKAEADAKAKAEAAAAAEAAAKAKAEAEAKETAALQKKEEDAPIFPADESEEVACPFGAAFGADFDQYTQCDDCPVRAKCKDKKEGKKPPVEEKPAKTLVRRRA